MELKVQLLGQARISHAEYPVDIHGHRPLALLAYLILTRKAHRREHLIHLFFDYPDDPRAALRWTLTKLRQAVGSEYILADREEVSFNFQSEYWLDVTAFEAGELELYQGELLEGLYLRDAQRFDEWLSFERQRLRGIYQSGLEHQLESERRKGDTAAIILTAQQLLKLDNLREDWYRALMEAYAHLGKRSAALETFEECRRALRKAWGLEPGNETVTLAEAIQRGEIGAAAPFASNRAVPSDLTAIISPAGEQSRDTVRQPQHGFPRFGLILLRVVGLLAVLLLVTSRVLDPNSQAPIPPGERNASTDGAGIQASGSQELAGTTVRVLGPYYYDTHAQLFMKIVRPFEERTGIDVVFITADQTYERDIATMLDSEYRPDIIILWQPGWLETLAEQGKTVDLGSFLDKDYLRQQYPKPFLELLTVDGRVLGIWFAIGLKDLVWYPKQAFMKKGYKVPETWDELIALSDQIVADGGTPWCIGLDDFEAKGWVGTDWIEEILLRTAPPEIYDAWVRHELPFNSPEIRRAFEIMGQIWLNNDYVYGGVTNILNESISESPLHLFENPPGCYLHKQASFARILFPEGARYGKDYDFFYLPPIDAEFGRPVEGNGDLFAMVNDRPEVREVMRYLTTAEASKAMIEYGGFLSPHKETPIEWYPTPEDLAYAQILIDADTFRFDGSDLMPAKVGLGTFYRGIIDWLEGTDLDTVLQEIDDSWPQ